MRVELDGIEVRTGGSVERCPSVIETAGAWVVAVSTVLQSRAIVLASCYLADLDREAVAVSHLRMLPGQRSRIAQRRVERMPGQTHARACLLDHAAELRQLLAEVVGEELAVDVDDLALKRAAVAWDPPR